MEHAYQLYVHLHLAYKTGYRNASGANADATTAIIPAAHRLELPSKNGLDRGCASA